MDITWDDFPFVLFLALAIGGLIGAGVGYYTIHTWNTPIPCGTFRGTAGATVDYVFKGYLHITNGTYPNGTQWAKVSC